MGRVRAAVVAGVVAGALAGGCGCAAPKATGTTPVATTAPATKPTTNPFAPAVAWVPDEKALLTLDQITPAPVLPKPRGRSAGGSAPLDALQWFAQARAAMAGGQRQTAINLLEKAVSLDPDSPELYEELGRAYGGQEKATWAFEQALELDPGDVDVRQRLGRNYLLKNKLDEAFRHLRIATLTDGYKDDPDEAAVVDFFLGRVLQRKGYDRAALETYARLAKRIE
ncbi:MAG TPA: tetratricopeptide repeat protein, partial [Tepidisphaeraceae bacterium]|nr:tetratricopeptide repeat protein [Tepidisphaeraceae bacterium]